MREIERAKNATRTAAFAVRRNCGLRTSEAYRIRTVRTTTITISVRTNAMKTAAIKTVRRWADIITANESTTNPRVRMSRVRCSLSKSQIKRGTRAEKRARVGTSHKRPETNRGDKVNNAATIRPRPSSRRISIDSTKEENKPSE